ncbi:hypothetical protein AX15_003206 [Amanita polypyramis BW_CC]|nr:hypothetical protein AX15_003206 [Amanita polypyramis BW_CC]
MSTFFKELYIPSRRLNALFTQCSGRTQPFLRISRLTSTSSHLRNPYPFPVHQNPTPHQIFHLPSSATEEDIKARYYDLVRIYHPDKAGPSVVPDIAHARFQAITAAYDILRGKSGAAVDGTSGGPSAWAREGGYPTAAAWRAASQAKRAQELYSGGKIDDRWKDHVFLSAVVLTVGIFVYQMTVTRREAMVNVVARSRHATANVYDRRNAIADPGEDTKRLGG